MNLDLHNIGWVATYVDKQLNFLSMSLNFFNSRGQAKKSCLRNGFAFVVYSFCFVGCLL